MGLALLRLDHADEPALLVLPKAPAGGGGGGGGAAAAAAAATPGAEVQAQVQVHARPLVSEDGPVLDRERWSARPLRPGDVARAT